MFIERAQPGDLIITLGGGDIYRCANMIVEKYRKKLKITHFQKIPYK